MADCRNKASHEGNRDIVFVRTVGERVNGK